MDVKEFCECGRMATVRLVSQSKQDEWLCELHFGMSIAVDPDRACEVDFYGHSEDIPDMHPDASDRPLPCGVVD
jgi:hypothetical protein